MTDLRELKAKIEKLPHEDRLRLAASLIDQGGSPKIIHAIVESVSLEMAAKLALQPRKERG